MPEKSNPSGLTTWDPFGDLEVFSRWDPFRRGLRSFGDPSMRWTPSLDVSEDDDQFTITVELAGASKDDVNIEVQDNVLTIRGEKRSEREEKKEQRRYVERSYGSFSRSFTLPANADGDRVEATFKDGVLTIEVPKREDSKPRTIAVK